MPALQQVTQAISSHAQSIKADKARETFLATPYSAGALLSWVLVCIARLRERGVDVAPALHGVDVVAIVEKWGWHRGVLESLAGLADSVLPVKE